ncbi:hypothetical protein HPB50_012263 [Hyalomma asiaticum]|uniref:Uncharacterized protein n=1 Tax=Hyalomma asiaticum TaxID=266040 RepID=A0ACB7S873_HYAAI|nr:hypothetical protein HPB50_012263 [Hyalomma asiaticum]
MKAAPGQKELLALLALLLLPGVTIEGVDGDPLYLTPLINSGQLNEARSRSQTGRIGGDELEYILGYSGYLTVNEEFNSNLFFWFVPAMERPDEAPVLVWLQGGPGSSSLVGFFVEHGPYALRDSDPFVPVLRSATWARNFSMLYVDEPVGAGYSFTESEQGYARNLTDLSRDMLEFLQQFFTLFPEYGERDFYVTGESFGGKFVPATAFAIHEAGDSLRVKINLKGIAFGNGLTDPPSMIDFGPRLYLLGLVDREEAAHFDQQRDIILNLVENDRYFDAAFVLNKLLYNLPNDYYNFSSTYFGNVTGYEGYYNFLHIKNPPADTFLEEFVQKPAVRQAIHVGENAFHGRQDVVDHMICDILRSAKSYMPALMDNYKVLVYSGQVDIVVPYSATAQFIERIPWSGAEDFAAATRRIWRSRVEPGSQESNPKSTIYGYTRRAGAFREVMIRNAGHFAPHDQPEATLDMMVRMRLVCLLLLCGFIFPSSICTYDDLGYQEVSRREDRKSERKGAKSKRENDVGEPLFLTPLIEAGKYKEALKKSRVGKVGDLPDILSYSGYITVDKELDSNLFFWFFPAMENPENAPVSLWLQGGPGTSSLFGLFAEHGPYLVDENGNAQLRPFTWARTISMLYVDNPVGAGFSFTQSQKGYSRNQTDVSRNMLEMLQQFFTLFRDYASNDFYLSGESYAGKYVPSIGAALHESRGKLRVPINFKGIVIGNGLTDPITTLIYGDLLYNIGLMDRYQARHMQEQCNRTANLIREKSYIQATTLAYSLILGVVTGMPTYFGNVTGYRYGYNYLLTEKPESHKRYKDFVITPMVRRAVHVGERPFNTDLAKVAVYFAGDLMQSVRDKLALMMDNYKALVYSGHLDIIVPSVATEALMYSLLWSGSEEWSKAEQKIWRSSDRERVYGYAKQARNTTMFIVRNAGHITPDDQPEAVYEMITRFVNNVPIAE